MVVVVGLTVVLPLIGTVPTPLIETVLAPVVVQLSVDCCPGWTLTGLAPKLRTCGLPAGTGATVTVAVAVTVPAGPTADRVYVVVAVGDTVVEPVSATLPTPGWMETLVAPCTTQVRVEFWPAVMLLGVASKRTTCAAEGVVVLTRVVA